MLDALSVPQRKISARVDLQDGRILTGVMYVPALGPDQMPCRLIDRLESSEEFLALTDSERTHLIWLARVVAVHVDDDDVENRARQQIETTHRSRNLRVKLHLSTGKELTGHVTYIQPSDNARLQDYLNTARRFFVLHTDNRHVYVNRAQIVSVFELNEPLEKPLTPMEQPSDLLEP